MTDDDTKATGAEPLAVIRELLAARKVVREMLRLPDALDEAPASMADTLPGFREAYARLRKAWQAMDEIAAPANDNGSPSTTNLIIDACVALESLLYPDLADGRCDPKAVNARLLAWIERNAMDEKPTQ